MTTVFLFPTIRSLMSGKSSGIEGEVYFNQDYDIAADVDDATGKVAAKSSLHVKNLADSFSRSTRSTSKIRSPFDEDDLSDYSFD